MNLYHIVARTAWIGALREGSYAAKSLNDEGFIHCSTGPQLLAVARQFYAGQAGLVLLRIDPGRLTSVLKWEPAAAGSVPSGVPAATCFPHVYGPINLDAVLEVLDFNPDLNGEFALPGVHGDQAGPAPR